MSNEMVPIEPMQLISKLLSEGAKVSDMTELFNLQERHEKIIAQKTFAHAITTFQSICPPVPKTKPVVNKNKVLMYKFADYADLMEIIQPYLTQLEIVPTFNFTQSDGRMFAVCRIRVGTWQEETAVPAGIPQILNANEAQNCGGATSFGKRYSLIAALNIRVIGEDVDATDVTDTLTKDEANLLRKMIDEICMVHSWDFPVQAFCNWLREGATKVEDIPRSQFVNAVAHLNHRKTTGPEKSPQKKGGK
jgi:hypothetical protein